MHGRTDIHTCAFGYTAVTLITLVSGWMDERLALSSSFPCRLPSSRILQFLLISCLNYLLPKHSESASFVNKAFGEDTHHVSPHLCTRACIQEHAGIHPPVAVYTIIRRLEGCACMCIIFSGVEILHSQICTSYRQAIGDLAGGRWCALAFKASIRFTHEACG